MARLTATLRARSEVGEATLAEMFRLYARYYDATSYALFREDLEGKQYVIELSEDGALRGFSTLAVRDFEVGGTARRALFSGDTIIDHRCWGEQALPMALARVAGAIKAQAPAIPLYWLLISKGYRTYRYLSLFAKQYYPHPDHATPADPQACIDTLAGQLFGAAYRRERGLVVYPSSRGHLGADWAVVKPAVRERADVRFFLERNPRYHEGEELCCLTTLEAPNLRRVVRKAFLEGHDEALLSADSGLGGAFPRAAPARAGGPAPSAARHTRA